jgi:hypothetical protein
VGSVANFVKNLQGGFSPPTVNQTLAALRMLFDWRACRVRSGLPIHHQRKSQHAARARATAASLLTS